MVKIDFEKKIRFRIRSFYFCQPTLYFQNMVKYIKTTIRYVYVNMYGMLLRFSRTEKIRIEQINLTHTPLPKHRRLSARIATKERVLFFLVDAGKALWLTAK